MRELQSLEPVGEKERKGKYGKGEDGEDGKGEDGKSLHDEIKMTRGEFY